MSTILDTIVATKRSEVAARSATTPVEVLRERITDASPPRGFISRLQEAARTGTPGVIAEVKKASPSKGVIRADFDPVAIAQSYAKNGASCISILTDEDYFQGSDEYLVDIRSAVDLPVIRKDFMVDKYQIMESRALGADCVLLIAACLDIMALTVLNNMAHDLDMDVLIEVHNKIELEAALSLQPRLIGINNRNLKTFETSLDNTIKLLPHVPEGVTIVTESGIATREHIALMQQHDVHCFLVGEAFMRAPDPGAALRELFF